jgi:nicotinate-nucleotide pyrophosphorylase (carboxylating)
MNVHENELIHRIIHQGLDEDLGDAGDITSNAIFSDSDTAAAVIRCKADGVLSGSKLIAPIFSQCDSRITTTLQQSDGAVLHPGTVIGTIEGPVRGILSGERICLNFLQRLSGIATLTSKYVKAISHTTTRLLDTRKTTPGLRYFEKAAVRDGGGCNHRFGLFDMILIKDTHVKRAGGVIAALEKAFAFRTHGTHATLKIEIEVQSVEEFTDALSLQPDRIMLDNMSLDEMRIAVALRNKRDARCELEASGNIQLGTIAATAETGVDFISVGALTHSAPALDIHLLIQ